MSITRIFFFGLSFLFTINFSAQNSVNDYKYVIVPEGYVFLAENDAYQMNSLTKFLFKKYGFTAFIRGEDLPRDLKLNGCKGLRADVRKKPSLLRTKLIVDLIDCNGTIIFSTREGVSREKEFKKSYHEALRNAFKDFKTLNYKYNGKKEGDVASNESGVAVQSNISNDSEKLKKDKPKANTKANAPKTVAVDQKPKVNKEKEIVAEKSISYSYNEETYVLNKKAYGYELSVKKDNSFVSLGKVLKSSRKNDFIVRAGELSGSGYFDSYGNFILDRINPATDKLITDTFARQ
ncbi:hypothetical protein [Aquimarina litoralis]|uniref:hypothetical protein n=1 Tax=Aquimarina litoralis TaxID=584605 RepID=UPI001C57F34A|nr:hypothetical protein [Aquimarina litoralis]MBW1296688.1 hypothetical protein [Aquimarina litoralis]